MKKLFYIIFSIFLIDSVFAQQDPEARKILDQFSEKTKSYSAYKFDFSVNTENLQTHEKSSKKGSILIKGEKYFMTFNETDIYFNGKNIWNYLKESNEVNITKPSKSKQKEDIENPSKLFNIYVSDYKFRYLGDKEDQGRECYEVDLYPFDIDKSYSIIRLHIDKISLELVSAMIFQKSGIHINIVVEKFLANCQTSDSDFVFDIRKHPGVEVIDLR
jgi:outer membrane lipoprotein-sorting protein